MQKLWEKNVTIEKLRIVINFLEVHFSITNTSYESHDSRAAADERVDMKRLIIILIFCINHIHSLLI